MALALQTQVAVQVTDLNLVPSLQLAPDVGAALPAHEEVALAPEVHLLERVARRLLDHQVGVP